MAAFRGDELPSLLKRRGSSIGFYWRHASQVDGQLLSRPFHRPFRHAAAALGRALPFQSHFPDVRMPQGLWKGLHLRAVVQSAVVEALRLRLGGARLALPLFL